MAHLSCSIEMEPRTLSEVQLSHAREVAVHIIQNMEPNDSSTAFIEGLKPVVPIKEMEQIIERRQQMQKLVDCKEIAVPTLVPLCDCACTSTNVDESPEDSIIREPLSAPF